MTAVYARRKFLHYYPRGFSDEGYVERERSYKQRAHERFASELGRDVLSGLITRGRWDEIARRAVAIEARTNLLHGAEKEALRDAVRTAEGARAFAEGFRQFLHGPGDDATRFDRWAQLVDTLPRSQPRAMTWPIVTALGFFAQPDRHVFVRPNVVKTAAAAYGFPLVYSPRPSFETYASVLNFCERIRSDLKPLKPKDFMDLHGFISVLGSPDQYPNVGTADETVAWT